MARGGRRGLSTTGDSVKVRMSSATRVVTAGVIVVERPDLDGDIYVEAEHVGCYHSRASVRRLIRALQWALKLKRHRKVAR